MKRSPPVPNVRHSERPSRKISGEYRIDPEAERQRAMLRARLAEAARPGRSGWELDVEGSVGSDGAGESRVRNLDEDLSFEAHRGRASLLELASLRPGPRRVAGGKEAIVPPPPSLPGGVPEGLAPPQAPRIDLVAAERAIVASERASERQRLALVVACVVAVGAAATLVAHALLASP